MKKSDLKSLANIVLTASLGLSTFTSTLEVTNNFYDARKTNTIILQKYADPLSYEINNGIIPAVFCLGAAAYLIERRQNKKKEKKNESK